MEVDSVGACSCSDANELQSDDDSVDADDLLTVYVGVEEADPVCLKIQDLLRQGKLSRERIFYKYLNDVLEVMYNPFHEYDQEVVEFFNTITYLGGKAHHAFHQRTNELGRWPKQPRKSNRQENESWRTFRICLCETSGRIYARIRSYKTVIFRSYGTTKELTS